MVNHGAKEYVRGDVHTNGIESFWALFKRGYHGVYHQMSKKHLQRYLNEFTFRFNRKDDSMQAKFSELVDRMTKGTNMSYQANRMSRPKKMHKPIAGGFGNILAAIAMGNGAGKKASLALRRKKKPIPIPDQKSS